MSKGQDAKSQPLWRSLPSVSKFIASAEGQALCSEFGAELVKLFLRELLEERRQEIKTSANIPPSNHPSAQQSPLDKAPVAKGPVSKGPVSKGLGSELTLAFIASELRPRLQRACNAQAREAVNATGILLHTGLGRAPLSTRAREALLAASGYTAVQLDINDNSRSLREERIEQYLKALTKAPASTIVNNNAAATFIILNALAAGKEVIISRGQLVEIGGSFRMPEVMAQSAALLKEVGTTNRTHLKDYQQVICENTAAILYVEPSNYKVCGFSGTPSVQELGVLAAAHNLPFIVDLGSGALRSLQAYGLVSPLTIEEALAAGAWITCSSGDKLIGGPQAGIICGRVEVVEKIRHSPFARMFRVDKLTLAAMEATLLDFVLETEQQSIPLYRQISEPISLLQTRAEELLGILRKAKFPFHLEIVSDIAYIGGGALAEEALPSIALSVGPFTQESSQSNLSPQMLSQRLREGVPPVFCRIADNRLVFSMRTVAPAQINQLSMALLQLAP